MKCSGENVTTTRNTSYTVVSFEPIWAPDKQAKVFSNSVPFKSPLGPDTVLPVLQIYTTQDYIYIYEYIHCMSADIYLLFLQKIYSEYELQGLEEDKLQCNQYQVYLKE